MAISATIAAVSATTAAVSYNQQKKAQESAQRSQASARSEQGAINAAQSSTERRQQIREERVRRARVQQASINTGVAGSSGELGAVGSLGVQLGTNLGSNLAMKAAAQNISIFNQQASDSMFKAQEAGQLFNLAMQGLSFAGPKVLSGMSTPAAASTRTTTNFIP